MLLRTELHPYHHQSDNGLDGWATRTNSTVRHRHVKHPVTAPYETRGFIGQLMKSSAEVEAVAEDTKVATRTVTVHPGTRGEAAEAVVDVVDIAVVMVEDTRVTGLATTQMTTVELSGSHEEEQVMAAHIVRHHLNALLQFLVELQILYD